MNAAKDCALSMRRATRPCENARRPKIQAWPVLAERVPSSLQKCTF